MKKVFLLILLSLLSTNVFAEKHVIFFSATWCGPCNRMKPNWNDKGVKKVLDKIQLHKIDIDEYQQYANEYGVRTIPQTIVVDYDGKDTKILKRHIGYLSSEGIIKMIGE